MEIGVKKLGPFLGPQFCSRAPDYIKMDQKCPQIEGFINACMTVLFRQAKLKHYVCVGSRVPFMRFIK